MEHHGETFHQRDCCLFPHIKPTNFHRTAVNVVEAADQPGHGGFTAAGRPDQCHHAAVGHVEGHTVQHSFVRPVTESHVLKINGPGRGLCRGFRRFGQGLSGQDVVNGVEGGASFFEASSGFGDAHERMGKTKAQTNERNGGDWFEGSSNGEVCGKADQCNDHHLREGTAEQVTSNFVPELPAFCFKPCGVGIVEFAVVGAAPTGAQRGLAMCEFDKAVAEFHFGGFTNALPFIDKPSGTQHKQQEYGYRDGACKTKMPVPRPSEY